MLLILAPLNTGKWWIVKQFVALFLKVWKQKIWSSNRELGGVDTGGLCPDLPGPPLPFLVPCSQLLCSFDSKGRWCSPLEPSSPALNSDKLWGIIYLPSLPGGVRLRLWLGPSLALGWPLSFHFPASPILLLFFFLFFFFLKVFSYYTSWTCILIPGSVCKESDLRHLVKNELIWSILTNDNSGQIAWKQTDGANLL